MTDWVSVQARMRDLLHEWRGHTEPPSNDCAPCDQDADKLADIVFEHARATREAISDRP